MRIIKRISSIIKRNKVYNLRCPECSRKLERWFIGFYFVGSEKHYVEELGGVTYCNNCRKHFKRTADGFKEADLNDILDSIVEIMRYLLSNYRRDKNIDINYERIKEAIKREILFNSL